MVNNTLNVGKIEEGFVLDHIQAGRSMEIYKYLHLDKLDCCVAIIKNAKSSKMGKKDIMKIECPIDFMDLDILGFIDHNITVNIIKNSQVVDKKALSLPKKITNAVSYTHLLILNLTTSEACHTFYHKWQTSFYIYFQTSVKYYNPFSMSKSIKALTTSTFSPSISLDRCV